MKKLTIIASAIISAVSVVAIATTTVVTLKLDGHFDHSTPAKQPKSPTDVDVDKNNGTDKTPQTPDTTNPSKVYTWDEIVASYPEGKIGQQYSHDEIARWGVQLFRVTLSNSAGTQVAIASGSDAGWYPPTETAIISFWNEVPKDLVPMYKAPQSPQGTNGTSSKTLNGNSLIAGSTTTAATDQVAAWDNTKTPVVDPAHSTNPNVDFDILEQAQDKISEVITKSSQTIVTLSQDATVATKMNLPPMLNFTGTDNAADFVPIKVTAGVAGKYDIKLYKLVLLNKGYNLNYLGDATVAHHLTNISNNDEVVLLAYDKSSQEIVQGAKYTVSSLSATQSSGTPIVLDDKGVTKAINDKNLNMQNIFEFMDSMMPGQVYTSSLANGEIKSFRIPDGKAMQEAVPQQNVPVKSNSIYAPFMDSSMALESYPAVSALYKYKALTFGFAQTFTPQNDSTLGTQMAWGGNVDVNDLGQKLGEDLDGLKMLKFMKDLRDHGVDVAVSLGGQTGSAVWKFYDPIILAKVLEEFVIGTGITRLDYDIEGGDLQDAKAMETLQLATAILQQKLKSQGTSLEISLTLASEWDGLRDGQKIMQGFFAAGVEVKYVNGMTMMMSPAETTGKSPVEQQRIAIDHLKAQVLSAFSAVGVTITPEQAYRLVGATPDFGTDTWNDEKMTPADVPALYDMLLGQPIGMFSYWNVQATEGSIKGMGGYQLGWPNPDLVPTTLNRLYDQSAWNSYDPKYHGTSALTNLETQSFILKGIIGIYTNGFGATMSSGSSTTAHLTAAETDGKPLQSGNMLEWISPIDGTLHLYKVNWYASADERPGSSAAQSGQFTDLGPTMDSSTQQALDAAQTQYRNSGYPFFSSMIGGKQNSPVSTSILDGSGQKKDILPYISGVAYPNVFTIVIWDKKLYINRYYGSADDHPVVTNEFGMWLPVILT